MTRDVVWKPSKYDSRPSRDESWFDGRNSPYPLHPGFDFSGDGGDKKGETGKETGDDDERGTSEEPSAPKRMKDVKKGRSFKKMFSSKKKKTSGFRGLDDDDDAKKS